MSPLPAFGWEDHLKTKSIMMTKEQMIDRYCDLYDKMKDSKDVKNMKIFGEAEKYMFKAIAAAHPEMAANWLSHLESIDWCNYLSEHEANNVGKRIVNQDGTKGFHWMYDVFCKAVEAMGGKTEDKPYYNSYALFVTANMEYSDHAKSISEDMGYKSVSEVPNERMALSCYRKAVEKLKDADAGFHVRKYFKGKMYDDSPM